MSGKDWHAVNVLNEDGKFTTSGQNDQIVGASSDVLDERVKIRFREPRHADES